MDDGRPKTLAEMAEEAERGGNGLLCPGCHRFAWRVYYTRPRQGKILRRRVCLSCGYKITTVERAS